MKILLSKGQIFGHLSVVKEVNQLTLPSGQKNRAYLCKCECGNETVVRLSHLIRGRIKSCGCLIKSRNGESTSRIFKTWKAMIERTNANYYIRSNRYKQRGIFVCDEWNDYFNFKNWALQNGYDDNLQIDRIDNNGNYEPSNCRFVTNQQNANNREMTFFVNYGGKKYAIMDLFRKLNIPIKHQQTIRQRINRGWNHNMAFDKPIKNGKYKTKIDHIA
jgi:hypothetical protein